MSGSEFERENIVTDALSANPAEPAREHSRPRGIGREISRVSRLLVFTLGLLCCALSTPAMSAAAGMSAGQRGLITPGLCPMGAQKASYENRPFLALFSCLIFLIFLARPERFELPTPRFVV